MRCLESWVLAPLPDGHKLFLEQRHHIYGVFHRRWAQKDPADMCCHSEIHFISVLFLSLFNNGKVDQSFRNIIRSQLCPDFLLNIFRFVSMEVAKPDGIFELSERTFNAPSGKIQFLDPFRREFIFCKIGKDTFIGIFRYGETYNPERQVVSVGRAI